MRTLHWMFDAHLAVGVDVDPLVVVAEEELHAVGVGEGHDGMGGHGALGVLGHVDVIHAEMERGDVIAIRD